jgi:hypothetical protein
MPKRFDWEAYLEENGMSDELNEDSEDEVSEEELSETEES